MCSVRDLKATFPYCYNIAFENSGFLNRALKSKFSCYNSFLKTLLNTVKNPEMPEAKIHESFRALMWFELELYTETHNNSQHSARFDFLNCTEEVTMPEDLGSAYSYREDQKSKNYRLKRHISIAKTKK